MIIAATGDVHSPRHFDMFIKAVDGMEALGTQPHLFLITGDMVHHGEVAEYDKIYNAMFGKISCPIVACFGNNEFTESREELKQRIRGIRFLDDQSMVIPVRLPGAMRDTMVGIVGTTGSLETPTPWQRSNVPNIERIYKERVLMVERHFSNMRADLRILIMHYSPTYRTLEGENPRFYSSMGWNVYENVLIRQKPDLVLHGHSHRGLKQAWVDSVPVLNVCLPLNERIVIIDTDKLKPGLAKFVE
jgi:Icc-related predicted phosphoesterase